MKNLFVFKTVVSMASESSNESWGTCLKNILVKVFMRPFPFKDIDRLEIYESNGRKINLNDLNKFEQEMLIQEANAEIKSGRFGN